jgi:arylsulfatase A-like enzyme
MGETSILKEQQRMGAGVTRRTFLKAVFISSLSFPACLHTPQPRKNIVCVLVDQLRKDYSDSWLKGVNLLAQRGLVFDQMRSVSPWTYPSVISMLSGLYPQQHGAVGHLSKGILATFSRKVPLLQKILKSFGYHTVAFVANPFLHTWNPFHKGFDSYDIRFVNNQGNRLGYNALVWKHDMMFANFINKAIVEYFEKQIHRAPEFTYIHYMDVHGPWVKAPFEPSYESSIRYIDQRIIEIYQYFMRRYDGNVLFFITSDHGRSIGVDTKEGYGPQWRIDKGSVHDFNLKSPFLILPSNHVLEVRTVTEPCMNIDFLPTVLDWLAIKLPYPSPAISLLPAVRGEPLDGQNRALYAKVTSFGQLSDGVVHRNKKYMRFFDPETRQIIMKRIFDLIEDPQEIKSLGDDFGEVDVLLREAAGKHGLAYSSKFDELDPEVIEKLRALGYLK